MKRLPLKQILLQPKKVSISSLELREKSRDVIEKARQLLKDASDGLVFEPVEHRYALGEREMESVSEIIKEYAPFDTEKVAEGCSRNPKHEHFGKSVQEILDIWTEKKNTAAQAGTQVHEFGEACCLYWEGNLNEIPEHYRCRILPEGFLAETSKEKAMVRWWNDLDPDRYCVVAMETRIVNPVLGYAGTFDLLLYDMVSMRFVLADYKTNEDLHKWYGGYMRTPLNMLKSSDIGKYTMQQNMYGIQLDNIGVKTDDMFLIWLKADGDYEQVTLENKYRKVITYALSKRLES